MILQLIPNTHPLLHERMNKCSYDLDRHEMSKILHENMIHHEGVGLSANQIGMSERVFIMMIDTETEETITCFNPRIVKRYDEEVWFEEGCLSYPDEIINIKQSYLPIPISITILRHELCSRQFKCELIRQFIEYMGI